MNQSYAGMSSCLTMINHHSHHLPMIMSGQKCLNTVMMCHLRWFHSHKSHLRCHSHCWFNVLTILVLGIICELFCFKFSFQTQNINKINVYGLEVVRHLGCWFCCNEQQTTKLNSHLPSQAIVTSNCGSSYFSTQN